MLRVVRGDDRRSWGILASRFCRRVDPNRLGKGFLPRRALDEALWMRRVGGEARAMPGLEDRRRPAVVHVGRRQVPQTTVMMRIVVPPEQGVADRPRILDRSESVRKFRPILEGPELGFGKRIVVAHARARAAGGDPEVGEQLGDELAAHRGAPVGMDRQLVRRDRLGAPPGVIADVAAATHDEIVWLGHPPLRVDLLKHAARVEFAAAWHRRVVDDWGGVAVSIISLEDLVEAKRASGCEQDMIDARNLERARGRQRRSD
jgi:hypothetical protein